MTALLLLACAAVSATGAADFTVFGPQTYRRTTGKPVAVVRRFNVPNPAPRYRLRVFAGGDDRRDRDDRHDRDERRDDERVSSAVISINGVRVLGPHDLDEHVRHVEKVVTLRAANEISVELRGEPGGTLVVEIVGVDNDRPSITASAAPAPNALGWNNSDVTVTFRCDDAISGVANCPAPVVVSADGDRIVSGTATDRAGNTASASVSVRLDKTRPAIAPAVAPPANTAGWHRAEVTVTFSCQDAGSGIATCTQPATIGAEGAGQRVNGAAVDKAGNSASAAATLNIDRTAPTIAASLSSPADASGWHRQDVTVIFTCSDTLSGIESCPAPVTVSADTGDAGQAIGGTAVDKAGNTASTSVTIRLDKSGPAITSSAAPAPNANGWQRADVTVTFTCSDGGSNLVSCSSPVVVSTEGANQQVDGTATDRAGNSATATLRVSLDKTKPTISATATPAQNAAGWNNAPVTVVFACADALSGIDQCPASRPVTEEGAGQSISGTALDRAGNAGEASASVNLDRAAPALTITSPPPGSMVKASPLDVSGNVTDSLSGVASVACGTVTATVSGATFSCRVPLAPGANAIVVVATDAAGNTATSTLSSTYDPNRIPTAIAGGPYSGDIGELLGFDGGGSSDPDGDALTYRWEFGDGRTAAGRDPAHGYDAVGVYTVTLTVDDGRGGTHAATGQTTIRPLNQRPVARILAPGDAEVGAAVVFDGSASSDPDSDPLSFTWTFSDGSSATGATVTHAFDAPGPATATLTVSDGRRGGVNATSTVVTVSPSNQKPVAAPGGPYRGAARDRIAFDGSASSDADGDPITLRWSFGDGGSATGLTPSHAYQTNGAFTVSLTVDDGRGGRDTSTAPVTIEAAPNRTPVARAAGPYAAEVGESLRVDGTGSTDADGDVLTYRWDFGDGAGASGAVALHAYAQTGTFTVTLTVSDPAGASNAASATTAIAPVADRAPPVITIAAPAEALPGTSAKITASAADNVGVSSVTFEVNGVLTVVTEPPYERIVAVPPIASTGATIAVKATARDAANNQASATHSIRITSVPDSQPPVVFLNAPARASAGSTIHLTAAATDNVQVASLTFFVDNNAIGAGAEAPFESTFTVPASAVTGSTLTIKALAVDASGNTGEASAALSIVEQADTAAPTVELSAPSEVVPGQRVGVSAVAQDNVGVAAVSFAQDGVVLATGVQPPYAIDIQVPALARVGSAIRVTARARDFSGLESVDERVMVVVSAAESEGILTGEVYDDGSGLPVEGATVALTGRDAVGVAYAQTAATDAKGRYLIRAAAGSGVVRIGKAGWTAVDRSAVVSAGSATEIVDARLTRAPAAATPVSIAGATITNGAARLTVPAGGVTSAASVSVQPVGKQGLQGILPAGWTPVAAVDLLPHGVTFEVPASLVTADPFQLAAETVVVVARWDEEVSGWRTVATTTAAESGLTAETIVRTGQYAFLIADAQPAPPVAAAVNAVLQGVPPDAVETDATVTIVPQPKILFYKPGVRSDVRSRVTAATPLTSGRRLLSRVGESYRFAGGTEVRLDSYEQDLFFYQDPRDSRALVAAYPVTASLEFDPAQLDQGTIAVELARPAAALNERVIGGDGGIVSSATGETVEVPSGAVAEPVPVRVEAVAPIDLGVAIPAGFEYAGGVQVSFAGAALGQSAVVSVRRLASLDAASSLLLVRVQIVQGRTQFVLVGLGRVEGDRVIGQTVLPVNGTLMEGVRTGGRYLFVRAIQPVGFAAGQVLGVGGAPFAGALVQAGRVALVSLSSAGGRYVAAAAIGPSSLTAIDLQFSDSGTAAAAIVAPREEIAIDVRLRAQTPRVVSASPSEGASNVPLSNPIVVTFSEPIQPASVSGANTGNVALAGPNSASVAGSVSLSANNTVLTFRPTQALAADTAYTFTVSQAIRDLSGYQLPSPFVMHFASLDTRPPAAPAAGTITASIPDTGGTTTVAGSQGTANPHDHVSVVNVTQGTTTPVLVEANGSFSVRLTAALGDKLQIRVVDAAGNQTVVDAPRFTRVNADGSVSAVMDADGGHVGGPNGLAIDVQQGTFGESAVVTLKSVRLEDFPVHFTPEQEQLFHEVAAIKLDFGGATPAKYVNVSTPTGPGDAPENQWIVAQVIDVNDEKLLTVVDTAKLIEGRIATSSPPFPGVLDAGVFAFVKSLTPLAFVTGTLWSEQSARTLGRITMSATGTDLPFVGYYTNDLAPSTKVFLPVPVGSDYAVKATDVDSGQIVHTLDGTASQGITSVYSFVGDTAAPTVEAAWSSSSDEVSALVPLAVQFSRPMDRSSVSSSFRLLEDVPSASRLTGSLSFTNGDRQAVFTPEQALKLGTAYSIELHDAVDYKGKPLLNSATASSVVKVGSARPVELRHVTFQQGRALKDLALRHSFSIDGEITTSIVAITDSHDGPQLLTLDPADPGNVLGISEAGSRQKRLDVQSVPESAQLFLRELVSCPGVRPTKQFVGDLAVTSSLVYDFGSGAPPVMDSHVSFYDVTDLANPCFIGTKILTTHPQEDETIRFKTLVSGDAYPRGVTLACVTGQGCTAYVAISRVAIMAVDVGSNCPTVPRLSPLRTLEDHTPYPRPSTDTYRPDYSDIAIVSNVVLATNQGEDPALDLYDTDLKVLKQHLALADSPRKIEVFDDGRSKIAFIGSVHSVQVVDLADMSTLRCLARIDVPLQVRELAVDPAARYLFAGGRADSGQDKILAIDIANIERSRLCEHHADKIIWEATLDHSLGGLKFDAFSNTLFVAGSFAHVSPWGPWESVVPFGRPMGTLNNVVIYSNTDDLFHTGDPGSINTSAGTPTGQMWECVEFVNRYYLRYYGVDIYKDYQSDAKGYAYAAINGLAPLVMNDGTDPDGPSVGDILIYDGHPDKHPHGHVGIVAAVQRDKKRLLLAQQNFCKKPFMCRPKDALKWIPLVRNVNGGYEVLAGLWAGAGATRPVGWRRAN